MLLYILPYRGSGEAIVYTTAVYSCTDTIKCGTLTARGTAWMTGGNMYIMFRSGPVRSGPVAAPRHSGPLFLSVLNHTDCTHRNGVVVSDSNSMIRTAVQYVLIQQYNAICINTQLQHLQLDFPRIVGPWGLRVGVEGWFGGEG